MSTLITLGILSMATLLVQTRCRPPVETQVPQNHVEKFSTETADDDRLNLPGFDIKRLAEFKNGKKCWKSPDTYSVCLNRNESLEWLSWSNRKKHIYVEIGVSKNGDVTQNWRLGDDDVDIVLSRKTNGEIIQTWKLKDSKLEYFVDGQRKIPRKKWTGESEYPEMVENSKSFIDSWCAKYGFVFGQTDCIIY